MPTLDLAQFYRDVAGLLAEYQHHNCYAIDLKIWNHRRDTNTAEFSVRLFVDLLGGPMGRGFEASTPEAVLTLLRVALQELAPVAVEIPTVTLPDVA